MKNINRTMLVGNIGNQPEVKVFDDGFKVVRLSIATTDRWTEKSSGDRKSRTEWHQVNVTNPAIIAALFEPGYVAKGDPVMVEGQLRTRSYEKDGVKRYHTEVEVGRFGTFSSLATRKSETKTEAPAAQRETVDAGADDVPF